MFSISSRGNRTLHHSHQLHCRFVLRIAWNTFAYIWQRKNCCLLKLYSKTKTATARESDCINKPSQMLTPAPSADHSMIFCRFNFSLGRMVQNCWSFVCARKRAAITTGADVCCRKARIQPKKIAAANYDFRGMLSPSLLLF